MRVDYEQIINEKPKCSKEVQDIIDRYKNAEISIMLYRNLCQIVLENEIKPKDTIKFYKAFASVYNLCNSIEEIKDKLINIIQ